MKTYKWTIEFEVEESWVVDGFDFSAEAAHAALVAVLPYAYNSELTARVVSAPDALEIVRVQGYTGRAATNEAKTIEAKRKDIYPFTTA